MSFSNSKLDSFVQEVLQGNGLNKSASVGYAPPVENNQSVVDAVNKAYSHLTQEEVSMADTLGFMEAANTVKQANYINEQIGGERNMSFYNQSQNPYLVNKSATAAPADAASILSKIKGGAESVYTGMKTAPGAIHAGAEGAGGYITKKMRDAYQLGAGESRRVVPDKVNKTLEYLEGHKHAVGYGVAGAGAAALAGAGLLGHKMVRQRQAMQKAKLEQSIGANVLGHLGRHAGKYALGAGILGAGALAYNSKAASDEAYLMEHAAQVGEEFIQKLASQAYENALVNELQLFREAAIDDVTAQQAYYGKGYGY
jgi:hypothetical protein